jgi:protein-S-isoprenylcysteine O-methyltransferase Ste14
MRLISARGARTEHRAGHVVAVSLALAVVHSLLAALPVKAAVRRLVGQRRVAGLYRLGYNLKSFAMLGWATLWFLRQPDRQLYRLRGPWALLARGVQLAGVLIGLDMLRVYGPLRFLGLAQAAALLRGDEPPATPEAQGPPPEASGELARRGVFGLSRHPDNLPAVLIFCGFPRMTANRAALAGVVALYAVLGSLHEDYRLRAAYGAAFERYARRVPFLVPRPVPAPAAEAPETAF